MHYRGTPNMLPMTYYGIHMLYRLCGPKSAFQIPPLEDTGHNGPELLEVMPGAALEKFCLPCELYKNGTRDEDKLKKIKENRKTILTSLASKSGVGMINLDHFRGTYLSHHDGLDSLVAAVVAARWKSAKCQFRHPTNNSTDCNELPKLRSGRTRASRASKDALDMSQKQAARREGWIYVPYPVGK